MGHEIIVMNDGTYITIEDGVQKLFVEAYRINSLTVPKDEKIEMIYQNGMSMIL